MSYFNNLLVPDDGTSLGFANVSTTDTYGVGAMREDALGNHYRWCKAVDAVTYVVGQCLTWANTACTSVTNDISGGSSIGALAAGVAMGAPAQNGYLWVQTWGPNVVLTNGDDDIAAATSLFPSGDGTVNSASAATFVTGRLGYALAVDTDAANTVAVFIEVW